jgi:hypothetical protein
LCSREDHGTLSSYVCQEAGLTTEHRVMEPGAAWRLQGQRIRNIEM